MVQTLSGSSDKKLKTRSFATNSPDQCPRVSPYLSQLSSLTTSLSYGTSYYSCDVSTSSGFAHSSFFESKAISSVSHQKIPYLNLNPSYPRFFTDFEYRCVIRAQVFGPTCSSQIRTQPKLRPSVSYQSFGNSSGRRCSWTFCTSLLCDFGVSQLFTSSWLAKARQCTQSGTASYLWQHSGSHGRLTVHGLLWLLRWHNVTLVA